MIDNQNLIHNQNPTSRREKRKIVTDWSINKLSGSMLRERALRKITRDIWRSNADFYLCQ